MPYSSLRPCPMPCLSLNPGAMPYLNLRPCAMPYLRTCVSCGSSRCSYHGVVVVVQVSVVNDSHHRDGSWLVKAMRTLAIAKLVINLITKMFPTRIIAQQSFPCMALTAAKVFEHTCIHMRAGYTRMEFMYACLCMHGHTWRTERPHVHTNLQGVCGCTQGLK